MEAPGTGERVPLVLSDDERIERLKARLDETAKRAAATELRIRESARSLWDLVPPEAESPIVISAVTAPGFSDRTAPLLAARRLGRR